VVRTAREYSEGPEVRQPLADALAGLVHQLTYPEPTGTAKPAQPAAQATASEPIAVYGAHHCRGCRHTGPATEHRTTAACADHQLLQVDITITARSQS